MRDVHSDEVRAPALRMEGFEGEWDRKPFGTLGQIIGGTTPSTAVPEYWGGAVHWFTPAELSEDGSGEVSESTRSITDRAVKEAGLRVLPPGTVLITSRASIGHVAVTTTPATTNQGFASLIPSSPAATWFVYNWVLAHKRQLEVEASGSTFLEISGRKLASYETAVPSPEEQSALGSFFSELDALVNATSNRARSLTSLKKTMLVKMFPQGTASTPEVRFEGFEGDWGTRSLGELGSIKTGPFGSTLHAEDYVSHGTPIITTEHFKTGNLTTYLPTLPQVSAKDRARLAGYSLTEGDIVFSRVGSVDVNAVVRPEHEGWLFSGRVLRVRLETEVDYEYLHWCLLTPVLREDITSRAVGQTMPSINTRILADTVVPVPSLSEQQAIGSYFRSLDALIEAEQRKLDTLRNLKSALLTQMFV